MEQEIYSILSHFGFSDQEIDVYLAALALKSPTVTQIAKKVQKGRTAVYFHIRNLQEKGLLLEMKKDRKQFYTALPPAEFANKVDVWAKDFKNLVPKLSALQKIEQDNPIIELSESKIGYWKIYEELSMLPENSEFRVLQGKKSLILELQLLTEDQLDVFLTRLVQKNIGTIGLFTKEALEVPTKIMNKRNQEHMRSRRWDLKILPKETLDIQQLMFLYNGKVAFLFPETSMVMTIRHKGIYETLLNTFNALHSLAVKVEPRVF